MFEALGMELPLGSLGRFVVAFAIVLVLIGATFWLIRRFGNQRGNTSAARGRQPRLGVIDVTEVEGRRLVLIRRDNVEHLILIGSSGDLVIEQNIVRAAPLAVAREMPVPRAPGVAEAMARTGEPVARGSDLGPQWTEPGTRPEAVTRPEPSKRPEPAIRAEHVKRSEPPMRAEPPIRTEPPMRTEPRLDGRHEPPVRAPRPPEQKAPPAAEADSPLGRAASANNPIPRVVTEPMPVAEPRLPTVTSNEMELNDMAQRLETALRRSAPAQEERAETPKPMSGPPPGFTASTGREAAKSEPVRPPTPDLARAPAVEPPTRQPPAPPQFGPPQGRSEPARPAPNEGPRAPHVEPKQASSKTVFDSLEQEMASLLGRPAGKD
jgi:flagellar protein FliO/FliZ